MRLVTLVECNASKILHAKVFNVLLKQATVIVPCETFWEEGRKDWSPLSLTVRPRQKQVECELMPGMGSGVAIDRRGAGCLGETSLRDSHAM
eukprot:3723922-Amphidinium_carterae.1